MTVTVEKMIEKGSNKEVFGILKDGVIKASVGLEDRYLADGVARDLRCAELLNTVRSNTELRDSFMAMIEGVIKTPSYENSTLYLSKRGDVGILDDAIALNNFIYKLDQTSS